MTSTPARTAIYSQLMWPSWNPHSESYGVGPSTAANALLDDYRAEVLAEEQATGQPTELAEGADDAAPDTDLRDRIRRVICEASGFDWDPDMLEPDEYGAHADAVLAVLPAPADRAAILSDAAAWFDGPGSVTRLFGHQVAAHLYRLADEAQQPAAAEELTATLVIGRSDSHCGGCGKSTLPRNTHHHDISGWTPRPGEGCGARFVAVRSDSRSVTADVLKDIRPDLPIEPLTVSKEPTR